MNDPSFEVYCNTSKKCFDNQHVYTLFSHIVNYLVREKCTRMGPFEGGRRGEGVTVLEC